MVAVTVFTHAGRAVGFLLKGHAGYGEQGEDLACAGISAITQTALLGITDVLKIKAKVTLEEGNALCLLSEDTPEGEREGRRGHSHHGGRAQIPFERVSQSPQVITQGGISYVYDESAAFCP